MAAPAHRVVAAPADTPRSVYVQDGKVRSDLSVGELAQIVANPGGGELWVDIDSTSEAQWSLLESLFHFHPLTLEDTRNPHTRVKLEEYDQRYLFIVIRAVAFEDRTRNPYDLRTQSVCFFLGEHYLVTVHEGYRPGVEEIAERLQRNPELLSRGAERLMHTIMDRVIDAFFPILDQVDEFTHRIEERLFVSFDQSVLREIFAVKRLVLSLRRFLSPEREIFNVLTNRPNALLSPESQIYFRDVYDHVLRITDGLDTLRELLGSTLDAYLTQVSNRLSIATKGLTIVATLSVPFVVLSGIWGMNVHDIPLANSPHGFWILIGVQFLIGILLLVALRVMQWL